MSDNKRVLRDRFQAREEEPKWRGPEQTPSPMAPREMPGDFCRTPLFLLLLLLLPCTVTGTELAINGNPANFSLPMEPGLEASLWCQAQNHTQAEELLWLRGDGAVGLRNGNRVNASNLCISPVSMDNNGVVFTSKLARDGAVQISVVLNVTSRPILSGADTSSVEEDKDATLNCHVEANPQAEMTWYKDNSTLVLEGDRHQVSYTRKLFQLTIRKAQKSDSGAYTCEAVSVLGSERRDFHLTVQDRKLAFPTEAIIAAAIVVFLTLLFAIVAQHERIFKCFQKAGLSQSNTAL
ncbi:transmembrane and immunoglobulin domain-containing protein 1 isoform X2 [Hemicordylus capensis]|uniref:transmembrane and immunoglobulin domain-containing protein 1 isoform X2 n=1 Tax=Hemicordylus capensis TaxID=884348 RepID=UPI00230243E1|nr:transmembrane and immunoglobulin domain-containing protein 1 isoform X2 [Hemicordylus capensis]